MGKGIISGGGDKGQYSVEIQLETGAIDAEIVRLQAQIADLEGIISDIESDMPVARENINTIEALIPPIEAEINSTTKTRDQYLSDIASNEQKIADNEAEISSLEETMEPLVLLHGAIQSGISSLNARIAQLEAIEPTTPEIQDLISTLTSQRDSLESQASSVGEEIADLIEQVAGLEFENTELSDENVTLQGQADAADETLSGLLDDLDSAQSDLADAIEEYSSLENKKSVAKLKLTAAQKRLQWLQDPANVPTNPTVDAWCADFTEDLSGDVGICEVAGQRENGYNIQPGYEDNAVYDADRDGKLVPAAAVNSPHVYWDWAMQDGWQKWMPTYRWGMITDIDHELDTCGVSLEDVYAVDVDGASVNQTGSLSDVPIKYMDCNSAPFEVGDEVLVKFEGNVWDGAKVIGFKEEPKGCYWEPWDKDIITETHPWHPYAYPSGRTPFSVLDGELHYSIVTTSWGSPMDSANDGMWIDLSPEDYIEASEVYIKIRCIASGSVHGTNEFYNYLVFRDEADVKYFITFNSSNDRFIHAEWTKAHPWPEINDLYISLPGATLSDFNIENDGTVPIVLPPSFSGKIKSVSIETGYDSLITSEFHMDFIYFKNNK